MARVFKVDRPVRVEAQVPESVMTKVRLELYSELENRVPHGKVSELVTQLLQHWLVNSRGVVL